MDYFLAFATMFVVFVVPLVILVGIMGRPINRTPRRRRGAVAEMHNETHDSTAPSGPAH